MVVQLLEEPFKYCNSEHTVTPTVPKTGSFSHLTSENVGSSDVHRLVVHGREITRGEGDELEVRELHGGQLGLGEAMVERDEVRDLLVHLQKVAF